MLGPLDNDLIRNYAKTGDPIGQRIIVSGRVLDEDARPVPGALVEFWQAIAAGATATRRKATSRRSIRTSAAAAARSPIPRGATPSAPSSRAPTLGRTASTIGAPPHIHFSIFGHAFAQRLITQMYFEGDPMIWQCPIVRSIPDEKAIERLVAALDRESCLPMDALAYKFDIVLRGASLDPVREPEGGQLMVQSLDRLKESPSQTAALTSTSAARRTGSASPVSGTKTSAPFSSPPRPRASASS